MVQSQRLAVVGLGIAADAPPVPEQPVLRDGIHLRWATSREIAFPWGGFFLYRRTISDDLDRVCAAKLFPTGALTMNAIALANAHVLSSDLPLSFPDDFAPPGTTECDLAPRDGTGRREVRFRLVDDVASSFRIAIGFRKPAKRRRCVELDSVLDTRELEARLKKAGVTLAVRQQRNVAPTPPGLRPFDSQPGLAPIRRDIVGRDIVNAIDAGVETTISFDEGELPQSVTLSVTHEGAQKPLRAVALDARGKTIDAREIDDSSGDEREIVFEPEMAIAQIRLIAGARGKLRLIRLCREFQPASPDASVVVTGWYRQVPVRQIVVTGAPGSVATERLLSDSIDTVTFAGVDGAALPDAAIVELCFTSVSATAGARWTPLLGGPIALPVTHPDYAVTGNAPENLPQARLTASGRVSYGPPADVETGFSDLHSQLVALVKGGPAAGAQGDPSRILVAPGAVVPPDPSTPIPTAPELHPLDLVNLAALHPAIAQAVGLYFVDSTAVPGVTYDYLVVADSLAANGVRSASGALSQWRAGAPGFEGYIVSNLTAAPAPPLDRVTQTEAFALTGAPITQPNGTTRNSASLAGIRWNLPRWNARLLPSAPILYHLWRESRGNGSLPASSINAPGDFVTKNAPILLTERAGGGAIPQRPADWPDPLHRLDRPATDGWYSYRVSGMDLFGRFSAPGDPATVRLIDRLPPPAPAAVEAALLDHADPLLVRDTPFTDYAGWRALFPAPIRNTLIGARVTWKWTAQQRAQAPDTAEFRVYFSPILYPPGSPPNPPLPDETTLTAANGWQQRVHVVPFDPNLPLQPDGSQVYEVLLPVHGGPPTIFPAPGGVPLIPTPADVVVFGYFGVSAVDATVGIGDGALWNGTAWGARDGNESAVSGPSKVYRVLRERPDPPAIPASDERVFASRADIDNVSIHTYRWFPRPNLRLHLCRALDATLFRADWDARPLPAVNPASPIFPDPTAEPRWTVAKKQAVCAELNALNARKTAGTTFAEAMTDYRALSFDARRALASQNAVAPAFTQRTAVPLDDSHADHAGPDNDPATYVPRATLRAFEDKLDGRATNAYFYRSFFVDGAGNRSALSLAGSPVFLPDVVAPPTPTILSALGGDRSVTIRWARSVATDLAGYRLYRAESADAAWTLFDMRAQTPPVEIPAADTQFTDNTVLGLRNYCYRITSFDNSGNESGPSPIVIARAHDLAPPVIPADFAVAWVAQAGRTRAEITFTSLADEIQVLRRAAAGGPWVELSTFRPPGPQTIRDPFSDPTQSYAYRLVARKYTGAITRGNPLVLPPA